MISAVNKNSISFTLITLICAYLVTIVLNHPVIPSSISLVHSLTEATTTHPTVVTFDNSYLSYKEDPLLTSIVSFFTDSFHSLYIIKLSIFTLGLGMLIHAYGGYSAIAPLTTLAIVSFIGEAPVLLSQLLWIPWLSWALVSTRLKRIPALLLVLFFSIRNYQTCGELSLLTAGFTWILCYPNIRYKNFLTIFFVFFPAILALISAGFLRIPCYPTEGRLVPDDALPEGLLPFFSSSLPMPSINRVLIKETLRGFCLGITLLSSVLSLFYQSRAMIIATAIAALLLFDLAPSEATAQLFPLANFCRLYPSLFLYSSAPLLISFFLITSSLTRCSVLMTGIISLSLFYYSQKHDQPLYSLGSQKLSAFNAAWEVHPFRKSLVTPSFHALYHHDFKMPLVEGRDYNKLRLWNIPHELYGSREEQDLTFVADDNGSTRWSPKIGVQDGKNWLLLKFPKRVPTIRGIQVDSGIFFSDFARGIRISAAEHCNSKDDGTFTTLAEHQRWEGSLATTQKASLPYFEHRYLTKIYFAGASTAQCYLIESIGKNSDYDWSIASLIPLEEVKQSIGK